jgi:hypothetical protein
VVTPISGDRALGEQPAPTFRDNEAARGRDMRRVLTIVLLSAAVSSSARVTLADDLARRQHAAQDVVRLSNLQPCPAIGRGHALRRVRLPATVVLRAHIPASARPALALVDFCVPSAAAIYVFPVVVVQYVQRGASGAIEIHSFTLEPPVAIQREHTSVKLRFADGKVRTFPRKAVVDKDSPLGFRTEIVWPGDQVSQRLAARNPDFVVP